MPSLSLFSPFDLSSRLAHHAWVVIRFHQDKGIKSLCVRGTHERWIEREYEGHNGNLYAWKISIRLMNLAAPRKQLKLNKYYMQRHRWIQTQAVRPRLFSKCSNFILLANNSILPARWCSMTKNWWGDKLLADVDVWETHQGVLWLLTLSVKLMEEHCQLRWWFFKHFSWCKTRC